MVTSLHPSQSALKDRGRLHSSRSQQLSVLEYHLILEVGSSERVKSTSGEGTVRASVGNKSVPK